ncbi:MAG: hypothetical protein EHM42_15760 [Planctomycetaceae bacterium]|nr:MAG: hypothetical protein EHM42_15760 [Planctomycetaceae bacterium]
MWFTENPWPPVLICCVLAAAALATWVSQRQMKWLYVGLGGLLLAVGLWQLERKIVTDRERVEQLVVDLVKEFQNKDREAVLAHFSPQALLWREMVSRAFDLVEIKDVRVTDLAVRMTAQNSEALSHFRANGTVVFAGAASGYQPSRWQLTWRRESGEWKVIDVVRLNPLRDEPLGILDPRAQ